MAEEYSLNDVFQVTLNGHVIDCIKASAYYRETIKASQSVSYCNYNKAVELIKLKMAVDESYNWCIWISNVAGSCTNPDGTTLSYSANDLLSTVYENSAYTTTRAGHIISDSAGTVSTISIFQSMAAIYALTNVPKGTVVILQENSQYTLLVKITDTTTTTQASDWYTLSIKSATSTEPTLVGTSYRFPVAINQTTHEAYIDIPIYTGNYTITNK